MDGDPIFCALLRNSLDLGYWRFDLDDCDTTKTTSGYLGMTPTVRTVLESKAGDAIEIVDFVPRYELFHRVYRPNTIVRAVKPLAGSPRVRARLHPTFAYGWGTPERTRGSNHIRYMLANQTVRLTTNVSVTFIMNELLFHLEEPAYFVLTTDESLTINPSEYFTDSLDKTTQYWEAWGGALNTPLDWQKQVIRASIILKLFAFEETGGIISSFTTSISPDGTDVANKADERYCFLRHAHLAVRALNSLNATNVMHHYVKYIMNVVTKDLEMQPVFGIGLENRLQEKPIHRLAGYRGYSPVSVGTKSYKQPNYGVYGAIIVSFLHLFYDVRCTTGTVQLFEKLERFGEACANLYETEDYDDVNGTCGKHTMSAMFCWLGCDRLAKIAAILDNKARETYWKAAADHISKYILQKAWNETMKSFVLTMDPPGIEVRGDLLLMWLYKFLPPNDERMGGSRFMRLQTIDRTCHFGTSFNFIAVLHEYPARRESALQTFTSLVAMGDKYRSTYAERFDPTTGEMWGNFPHITATSGLIECANLFSRPWSSIV